MNGIESVYSNTMTDTNNLTNPYYEASAAGI